MKRKAIIAVVLGVIVLGAGGIVAWYRYQGQHFVSTDDARVAADVVAVSPQIGGNVLTWDVTEAASGRRRSPPAAP